MQEILLVNPAHRPKKRKSTKRASPAQIRARKAFAAMARARAKNPAKRRAKRKAARRTNPITTGVTTMAKRRSPRRAKARRRNPIAVRHVHHAAKRKHHRARRRNPIGGSLKPMSLLTPALIGALGATAVNTITGKLPLPASLTTGNMKYITQLGMALGLAIIGSKVGGKRAMFAQMAEGSMTVTLHQAITDLTGGMGMGLSGMGYYLPGYGAGNAVPSASGNAGRLMGMGAYVNGPGSIPGVNPSRVAHQTRAGNKLRGFAF